MAGRRVVRVTRHVGLLLAVCKRELDLASHDVTPMRTLAAVVGKPFEKLRDICISPVSLEPDRVAAVEMLEMPLDPSTATLSDAVFFDALGMNPPFLVDGPVERVSDSAQRSSTSDPLRSSERWVGLLGAEVSRDS